MQNYFHLWPQKWSPETLPSRFERFKFKLMFAKSSPWPNWPIPYQPFTTEAKGFIDPSAVRTLPFHGFTPSVSPILRIKNRKNCCLGNAVYLRAIFRCVSFFITPFMAFCWDSGIILLFACCFGARGLERKDVSASLLTTDCFVDFLHLKVIKRKAKARVLSSRTLVIYDQEC